jgi:hypothetical protein
MRFVPAAVVEQYLMLGHNPAAGIEQLLGFAFALSCDPIQHVESLPVIRQTHLLERLVLAEPAVA